MPCSNFGKVLHEVSYLKYAYCASQTPRKARSRVSAHSSKLWPCTGNWVKSRGWALFRKWALFRETMVLVFNTCSYSNYGRPLSHIACVSLGIPLFNSLLWPSLCTEKGSSCFVLPIDLLGKMLFLFTVNCLDRHVAKDPSAVAIIWEKNNPGEQEKITYKYVGCNSAVEIFPYVDYSTILHMLYFALYYNTERSLIRPVR